MTNVLKIAL
jgi:hypothetical protein